MKTILSIIAICTVGFAFGQNKYQIELGNETIQFNGYELYPDNGGETTYYMIENGELHYYYWNVFNDRTIEFQHLSCPVKSINLKETVMRPYDEGGNFLYLKTKKLVAVANHIVWTFEGTEAQKAESQEADLMLIVPSEEKGNEILQQIKKGKDI